MALDALQKAKSYIPRDNGFYRNYYHYFFYGLMVLILLMLVGVGIVLFQTFTRPLPVFYAVKPDANKMVLTSFEDPNLLPDTLINWASKAAITSYTFVYVNYNQQLEMARPYFTQAGWQDYQQSISDVIDTIVKNKLIINGIVSGAPVISNQGPLPGRGYTWRIQIPFLVTYQSANETTKRNYFVVITIVKVPTTVNPQGIGIDQFVMI